MDSIASDYLKAALQNCQLIYSKDEGCIAANPVSKGYVMLNNDGVKFKIMDDVVDCYTPVSDAAQSNITPIHQSLNLRKALDGVDDLIIKLKDKKKLISLDQEGYKDIMALYSEIIRDLIDYKDLLCNSNLEDS